MSGSDSFSDREHYFRPSVGLRIQNNIWCSPEIFLLLCIYVHRAADTRMNPSLQFLFLLKSTTIWNDHRPFKSLQPNISGHIMCVGVSVRGESNHC